MLPVTPPDARLRLPSYAYDDRKVQDHYDRLHAALFDTYNLQDVVRYIETKTYLNGDRYSFKDHEFQKDIISDTNRDVYCQKCAQVGLSEIMARYVIGLCRIMPYFSAILTMPYSGDAANFVKTRVNPFIEGSPDLKDAIGDLNNTSIKAIGTGTFYARGTSGETSALSVPADLLVHDEVDRSDAFTLAQYQSRIKHSRWRLTRLFGTPTMNGVGIALAMESAMRRRHMVKCHCCNHYFVPSYHTDVVIPGYDGEKKDINKDNLNKLRWREAYVMCPSCHGRPSLQIENRSWVVENTSDNHDAHGYYVTPFSVPNVVSTPQLVLESTKFVWHEFCNQSLGETNSDRSEELTKDDVEACEYFGDLDSSAVHCIGGDMGNICHIFVGRMTNEGELLVVHRERIPMVSLVKRLLELKRRFRVLTTVLDAYPHTDMVLGMQRTDKNLFGGVYHRSKRLATFAIVKAEEDASKGKLPITQAQIHRNINFDQVMALFKKRKLLWATGDSETRDLFVSHCLDMKRKMAIDRDNDVYYDWVKNAGRAEDHFHHALGYLHVACQLNGMAGRGLGGGSGRVVLVTKLKVTPKIDVNDRFSAFRS